MPIKYFNIIKETIRPKVKHETVDAGRQLEIFMKENSESIEKITIEKRVIHNRKNNIKKEGFIIGVHTTENSKLEDTKIIQEVQKIVIEEFTVSTTKIDLVIHKKKQEPIRKIMKEEEIVKGKDKRYKTEWAIAMVKDSLQDITNNEGEEIHAGKIKEITPNQNETILILELHGNLDIHEDSIKIEEIKNRCMTDLVNLFGPDHNFDLKYIANKNY